MEIFNECIESLRNEANRINQRILLLESRDMTALLNLRQTIVFKYYENRKTRYGRLKRADAEFNNRLKEEINNKLIEFDNQFGFTADDFPERMPPYKYVGWYRDCYRI